MINHVVVCPHCGKEQLAYITFLNEASNSTYFSELNDEIELYPLHTMKCNMSPTNKPLRYISDFTCYHCLKKCDNSDEVLQVNVVCEEKQVKLISYPKNINSLLRMLLNQSGNENVDITFPVMECLKFNLGNGHIYISYYNADDIIISKVDITEQREIFKECYGFFFLKNYNLVKQKVIGGFKSIWSEALPFTFSQTTPEKLIEMTRFINYPTSFYYGIPYTERSSVIPKEMKKNAEIIQNSYNAISLLEQYELPPVDWIKQVFFKKPALFFYIEEIALFGRFIGDLTVLKEVLSHYNIFELLQYLHFNPSIHCFFKDYYEEVDGDSFLNLMTDIQYSVDYAKYYTCLSESGKNYERKTWRFQEITVQCIAYPYSLPIINPYTDIKDCLIDGFTFEWVKSTNELYDIVQNFQSLEYLNKNVIVIKLDFKIMAVIDFVDYVFLVLDSNSNEVRKIEIAFAKWSEKFNITYIENHSKAI